MARYVPLRFSVAMPQKEPTYVEIARGFLFHISQMGSSRKLNVHNHPQVSTRW